LFHPNTVDACFTHDGSGICGGIRNENGNWNTSAHKDRIVRFGSDEIKLLSNTFEDGTTEDCAKLVRIHQNELLEVLKKISNYKKHVRDANNIISAGFHETNAVDDGLIKPETCIADINNYGLIYKGPQFNIGNPFAKTPRSICNLNCDYDAIDLTQWNENHIFRTNFVPAKPINEYRNLLKGFQVGQDDEGKPVYEDWLDYYKLAFRSQLNISQERTLICAVLPRRTAHIHAVISTAFRSGYNCVDMAALCSSIVMDFYVKTIGAGGLFPSRMQSFPLGVVPKYQSALYSRTLLLNCLTNHYADLWEECWRDEYAKEQWSITDSRLKPFNGLERKWSWNTPLRNYFERRQALVEIDVIAAMALGLSLKDLELIYRIQFPVLQQNENDTWYDTKGNIVFTCSRGLTGVGVDRPVWNTIRDMKPGETYLHTIEKSELYKGQQVTYYAPFTRCDRIEDYRRAWAHFEPIFNK
jgi:hypothetical protein